MIRLPSGVGRLLATVMGTVAQEVAKDPATVAKAAWLGPLGVVGGLVASVGANLISSAIDRHDEAAAAARDLLANQDLARVQAAAIRRRLDVLVTSGYGDAPLRAIAVAASDWWPLLLTNSVDETVSVNDEHVTAAISARLTTGDAAGPSATQWKHVLVVANSAVPGAGMLDDVVADYAAAALAEHFVHDMVEALKADAAVEGKAFAAVVLRFFSSIVVGVQQLQNTVDGIVRMTAEIRILVEQALRQSARCADALGLQDLQASLLGRLDSLERHIDDMHADVRELRKSLTGSDRHELRRRCREQLEQQLGRGSKTAPALGVYYDPELYQARTMRSGEHRSVDCVTEFGKFLRPDATDPTHTGEHRNCFVITGRTGHGKTTLLCKLAETVAARDEHIVVLVPGRDLRNGGSQSRTRYDLAAKILTLLGGDARPRATNDEILDALRDRLAGIVGPFEPRPWSIVCFVDAINEVPHASITELADLSDEIHQLIEATRGGPGNACTEHIRICISCRDEYWPLFTSARRGRNSEVWLDRIWNPIGPQEPTVRLDVFNEQELEQAQRLYFKRYHIVIEPHASEALDRILCEPVLLRYFCEAYGTTNPDEPPRTIENPAGLTRLSIFEQMAARHREALGSGMAEGGLSANEIYERTTALLLNLANHMYQRRVPSFTDDEAYGIAEEMEHPDLAAKASPTPESVRDFVTNPRSTFARMVGERLVLERRPGDGQYTFVFDSYYEFTLGRFFALRRWLPLLHAQEAAAAYAAVEADLRSIIGKEAPAGRAGSIDRGGSRPEVFNAVAYAILLVERDPSFHDHHGLFWRLIHALLSEGQSHLWRQLGFAILRDSQFALASTWETTPRVDILLQHLRDVLELARQILQSADHTSIPDTEETLKALAAASPDARRLILDTIVDWARATTAAPERSDDEVRLRLRRLSATKILSVLRRGLSDPTFDQHFAELCRLPTLATDFWSARSLIAGAGAAAADAADALQRAARTRYFDHLMALIEPDATSESAGIDPHQFGDAVAIRGAGLAAAVAFARLDQELEARLAARLHQENHPWVWWVVLHAVSQSDGRLAPAFERTLVERALTMDSPHVRQALFRLRDRHPHAFDDAGHATPLTPHPRFAWIAEPVANNESGSRSAGIAIVYHPVLLESEHHNHPECRERLASILFALDEVEGLAWFEPRTASEPEIRRAHTPKTDAHRNGAPWTDYVSQIIDTSKKREAELSRPREGAIEMRPGMFEQARVSAGAVLTAVDAVLKPGSTLRSAFAVNRPPGHLANNTICVFNNVAVAAMYALGRGVERIVVVDFDAHHGQHTSRVFASRRDVVYLSIHLDDSYSSEHGLVERVGTDAGEGFTFNLPYAVPIDDAAFVRLAADFVVPVIRQFRPQLVLFSAGFDGLASDPLTPSGGRLTPDGYAAFGRLLRHGIDSLRDEGIDTRVAGGLEGGYSLDRLGRAFVGFVTEFGLSPRTSEIRLAAADDACRSRLGDVVAKRLQIVRQHERSGYPFSFARFEETRVSVELLGISIAPPQPSIGLSATP